MLVVKDGEWVWKMKWFLPFTTIIWNTIGWRRVESVKPLTHIPLKNKLIRRWNQVDCRVKSSWLYSETKLIAIHTCLTFLSDALLCRLFANSDDGEAAITRCGNRCPYHACGASVSRVRRFRITRVPLSFHACGAFVSRVRCFRITRVPLPVYVCRPDIVFFPSDPFFLLNAPVCLLFLMRCVVS